MPAQNGRFSHRLSSSSKPRTYRYLVRRRLSWHSLANDRCFERSVFRRTDGLRERDHTIYPSQQEALIEERKRWSRNPKPSSRRIFRKTKDTGR
ncbi:uncharacterized protein N7487_002256 [Penicillium crustosum]|uniref:uncharacterized protein n=1 Tax=Penicillium crustosum TaxID=36656 RepID=UPI002384538A|nr:uncharacterized protein N7487_002256 [Penicillium crustosum]KAJ5418706.1 hypothetical protein N7487_002256 [Penicillium crustosum]